MSLDRRQLLLLGSALVAAPLMSRAAFAADEILVGGINDISGALDLIGKPMRQLQEFAVHEINAKGGLLGRKVRLVGYDAQSTPSLYGTLAKKLSLQDRVAVVQGGITSASREIIRPELRRNKTLYFYNTFYEGGSATATSSRRVLRPVRRSNASSLM
jgi:urea transport system substrate-binding protein